MRNEIIVAAALSLLPCAALAHVTLVEPSALPGAQYVAHFRVGHGCNGSPTTALSIAIPDGVSDVQPQSQTGWTLETRQNGTKVSTVTWKGGNLAADMPGEFTIRMTLPTASGVLAFPATQTCEKGSENWAELPAADGHALKNPAPLLHVSKTPIAVPDKSMTGMSGMKK